MYGRVAKWLSGWLTSSRRWFDPIRAYQFDPRDGWAPRPLVVAVFERAWSSGRASDRQSEEVGSIPTVRSIFGPNGDATLVTVAPEPGWYPVVRTGCLFRAFLV